MSSAGLVSDRLLLVEEERYEDEAATYPQSYQNSPAYPPSPGMLTFKRKCDPAASSFWEM